LNHLHFHLHHFDQLKFREIFNSSLSMLFLIQVKSRLLMLILAMNMFDGNDCEDWGSSWILGGFADSIRVFLLDQTVCSIDLDFVRDHS
jgi:hypothetical protein